MRVKCLYNKGVDLRAFEEESLKPYEFGKYGTTEYTNFEELEIGKKYIVMGIITFDSYIAFLIDDGLISTYPCELFEVVESAIPPIWHFRLTNKNETIYPFIRAILGYKELCFNSNSYERLIVDQEDSAIQAYFRRKQEMENFLLE